jgi:GNAT superfamily N-acetyltransferase
MANNGINLVPAFSSHVSDILIMMEDFYMMFDYPFEKEKARKNLHDFIRDQTLGRLWLLRENEKVIGYAALAFGFSFGYGGKDATLDEFFLVEEVRSKGVGKKALNMILDEAKKLNLTGIHLEVEKDNPAAKGLYKDMGFSPSELEWHHFKIK